MNKIEQYNLLQSRLKRLNDKKVLTLDAMREIWDSLTDVEKQELDNQRYMVENNMFRSDNDVQINIAELFSQEVVDKVTDGLSEQLQKFKNHEQTEEDAKAILKNAEGL